MDRWQGRHDYGRGRYQYEQGPREYRQGRYGYRPTGLARVALALFTCVALSLVSVAAVASSSWGEIEFHVPASGWSRGHWLTGIFVPNWARLNEELVDNGFGSLHVPFVLWGGGTFSEHAGLSVTGIASGGNVRSTRGAKRAQMSAGFGLIEVAYVRPGRGSHVQAGALLGVGGSTLTLSDSRPGSLYDTRRRAQAFLLFGPSVGVRFDLTQFSSMHMKTGYLFALQGPWSPHGSGMSLSGAGNMSGPLFMIGFTQRFGRGKYKTPKRYEDPYHHRRRR